MSQSVYRSSTGTGTPDSNPGEWTLVDTVDDDVGKFADDDASGAASVRYYIVKDADGAWSNVVQRNPVPASSDFEADITEDVVPFTVTFSWIPAPGRPSTYSWKRDGVEFSTAPSPSLLFQFAGEYDISLTTTNATGGTETLKEGHIVANASSILAPSMLTVTPGAGSLLVEWQDNSDNETGFELYRSIIGGDDPLTDPGNWELIDTLPAGTTSYEDEDVEVGEDMFYIVRAVNSEEESPWSNIDSGIPL